MELISHAQNYEDIRLWRAFRDVENGRYLDIGTQDPNRDSVSRLFYDRGWRGVHVEPTPYYAAAMREARPDETVIEAAVSISSVPKVLFEIPETGLSTGVADIAKFHEAAGWKSREIVVTTITLADLFEFMGQEPIHWLKIDVEGMEAEVLESWGDHPARPAALVIEATKPNTQEPMHGRWHGLVTRRGYREVLFDGLSRYFIHETHAHRGEALGLSPNVFDGFQVLRTHFSAGRIGYEIEQSEANLRGEAESLARQHAEQLAQVSIDATVQLEAAQEQVTELEGRLEAEAAAHNHDLWLAQTAADEAAAQLDAAHQRADELEGRLASETEALGRTLAQARSVADDAAAQLEDALQRAGKLEVRLAADAEAHATMLARVRAELDDSAKQLDAALKRAAALEGQLASEVTAHAADIASLKVSVAETAGQRDEALGKAEALAQQLAAATASHASTSAQATAALAKVSAKLEVAQTRSAELQARLRDKSRLHAAALRLAEASTAVVQGALADTSGKLADLEAEHRALGRLAGQLEGRLKSQEERFASTVADAVAQRAELHARLDRSQQELIGLRDVAADLRADLASEIARAEATSVAAAAQREALEAHLAAAGEQVRRLTEQSAELASRLTATSEERDMVAAMVRDLAEMRDGLAQELNATRQEAAEIEGQLRDEMALVQERLSTRELKLAEAHGLLGSVPYPLAGMAGLRQALTRWLIGPVRLIEIADYQMAAMEWQQGGSPSHNMPLLEGSGSGLDWTARPSHALSLSPGAEMLVHDGPITAVADLLAANGRTFVHSAYWALLGRGPDAQGEVYYLTRLRAGVHKLSILKQMRRSPEGRAFEPVIPGVDNAIKRHSLVNLPVIGALFALFVAGERDSSVKVAMRRMEQNVIAEMARMNSSIVSGELKGALDWIDARIGRLLEVSGDVEARTIDIEHALDRIAERSAGLQAGHDEIGASAGSSAQASVGPRRQQARRLKVRDLHDRTGSTSVDEVLRHIELELI